MPTATKGAKTGSLRWGIDKYRSTSSWDALEQATRKQRENIYRQVISTAGDELLSRITQKTIIAGRERRAAKPHSANNFLKAMRGFFEWAAGEGQLVALNPCIGVKLLKGANDEVGFHTWTIEEVERFEARWTVGTRERLAMDILLYTGLRRGDAVTLGRQHVRDGWISIRTEKTGEVMNLPVLPPLAASIDTTKTGDLAFLVTSRGTPFVKESFGTWFAKACREAKCPGSAHGLRKAGAARAAERGATDRQLMALFGWTTAKMATHYTKAADRKRLAREGAEFLMPEPVGNKKSRTSVSGAGKARKSVRKSGA